MRLCLKKKEKKGGREEMRERSEFLVLRRRRFDGHARDSVIRDTLETAALLCRCWDRGGRKGRVGLRHL